MASVPTMAMRAAPGAGELDLSIVVPCLDEAKTIEAVVTKGLATIERLGLLGEVLVSDNGSVDGSSEVEDPV